tara:strand:- start:45 stop:1340 length:1296 start_codon:yes stop_codon:yes gene_type:complete
MKNQEEILKKMGIEALKPMQTEVIRAIDSSKEILLLSPTGTGKTLAFLLPLIRIIDPKLLVTQLLILVPTRELAIQLEQVIRDMGTGFKVNAVYGGRSGAKEKVELTHAPNILVGTPGRVSDHIRRDRITVNGVKNLVIDEFDKCLEIGFEKEMKEIVSALNSLDKKILTSATHKEDIPLFMDLQNPICLNFLEKKITLLDLYWINSSKNTLETLMQLLTYLGTKRGIIFCNFKHTLSGVSEFLEENHLEHTNFFGGMEQIDRERSLIQFRNYSQRTLLATDLAARGIDIPGLDYIIHYEMPEREEEFIHRNGRTARMNSGGAAFCIKGKNDRIPEYAQSIQTRKIIGGTNIPKNKWKTIYISGGRKDKISKGDIAGFFIKKGNIKANELGVIELKNDCAFIAVATSKANALRQKLNNERLKKKKVRISFI